MNINTQSCSCSAIEKALTKCPSCSNTGIKVNEDTLRKHIKKESYATIKSNKKSFNFCTSPQCDTVYYSNESDETFSQEMVKHKIAAKNEDLDTPLCYCKRFTKQDAIDLVEAKEENISGKILDIIGNNCKCSKTNPKGVSCIEDITNFLKPHGIDFNSNKSCCSDSEDDALALTFMKAVVKGNGMNVTFTKNKSGCC